MQKENPETNLCTCLKYRYTKGTEMSFTLPMCLIYIRPSRHGHDDLTVLILHSDFQLQLEGIQDTDLKQLAIHEWWNLMHILGSTVAVVYFMN